MKRRYCSAGQRAKGERKRDEILNYLRACEHPVTIREIGDAVGLSSTSTVHGHIKALLNDDLVVRRGGANSTGVIAVRGPQEWLEPLLLPMGPIL